MPPILPSPPDSMIISFMTLRKWVGILGVALAPVLVIGCFILHRTWDVRVSVSAYYHSKMGDGMVGIICGISLFLLSYHGYDRRDSIVSKLAGFFALGIAFFPTSQTGDKGDIVSTLHYIFAGIFFALIPYMSIFLFTKSAGHKTSEKIQRNRIYRVCGIIMVVAFIGIPIVDIEAVRAEIGFLKPKLVLETIALTAFGFSWLVKGEFILKDKSNPYEAQLQHAQAAV